MIKISKSKIRDFLLISVLSIVLCGVSLFNIMAQETSRRVFVIGAFCVTVITLYVLYKRNGAFLNPTILFLLSFYTFQNGQLLLYELKIPFQDNYYHLAEEYIYEISCFSSCSALLACVASVICGVNGKIATKSNVSIIEHYDKNIIGNRSFIAFSLISLIIIPLTLRKIPIAIKGGYDAIREYESSLNSVINFLDFMFIPFAILALIFDENIRHRHVIQILGYLYFCLTLYFGDRTTAIAGIIVFYLVNKKWIKKDKRRLSLIKFFCLVCIVCIVIYFGGLIRNKREIRNTSIFQIMISSFSEMGFSFFPLYTMMKIVPIKEGFMLGKGYLASFVGGFLPSFLDPTGTVEKINQYALIYHTWQAKYFSFSFGLGFSLNAEAYANFGWFGLFFIFLLCLFIFKLLNKTGSINELSNPFRVYIESIMLFLIFTLPRRGTYTLWNSVAYGIVFMYLFILFLCNRKSYIKSLD